MPDRLTCSRINEEIHKLTLLGNGECQNDRAYLAMFLLLVVVTASAWAQTAGTSGEVENVFPQARALYVDVHQNPELSGHEMQTAEKLASRPAHWATRSQNTSGATGLSHSSKMVPVQL